MRHFFPFPWFPDNGYQADYIIFTTTLGESA